MLRFVFAAGCMIIFAFNRATACTTFFINHNNQLLFGRNYDWVTGSGMVHTNLRGLAKSSFQMREGKTVSWTSKYGSVTFNQYGKEFPTGGMNEKGLVVELMWLDETRYPAPDDRPAISVLQWIQYQLDNCAGIDEVLATDKYLRIATVGTTPLHYLVADKQGNAATIEFLDGKMIVHKGTDLRHPVLTNSTYSESVSHYELRRSASNDGSSLSRFSKACSMVQQFKLQTNESPVSYAFDILKAVSQGSFTQWSIVYDIRQSRIYFKTNSQPSTRFINLHDFEFDCTGKALAFNMNERAEGSIAGRFAAFSRDSDLEVIGISFQESADRISVPASYIQKISEYSAGIVCK